MALREPIAAYNAANNVEAHLVCNLLQEAGIEAVAIDNVSAVGHWLGGLMPEVHKPQVWIERDDVDRAKPILDQYEQRITQPHQSPGDAWPIGVTCEECGKRSLFPAEQIGSVGICPHCKAYVDIEEEAIQGLEQLEADNEHD